MSLKFLDNVNISTIKVVLSQVFCIPTKIEVEIRVSTTFIWVGIFDESINYFCFLRDFHLTMHSYTPPLYSPLPRLELALHKSLLGKENTLLQNYRNNNPIISYPSLLHTQNLHNHDAQINPRRLQTAVLQHRIIFAFRISTRYSVVQYMPS